MSTQIVCAYTIVATGPLSSTALGATLAAAPLDTTFLYENGLRLITDISGGLVRTITMGMDAVTPATATPNIGEAGVINTEGTHIVSVTTVPGTGYVRPPIAVVVPVAGNTPLRPAILTPQLGAVSGVATAGGVGYAASTTLVASGGLLAPGGTQATWSVTNTLGVLSAPVVVTAGGPYNAIPTLTAVDPTGVGVGATFTVQLGLTRCAVASDGKGYLPGATVLITPYFKSLFPDAAGPALQASAVANFMQGIIQITCRSPVAVAAPVVS